MPTIKCPTCGHSSFHSNVQCVNCGAPLVPESAIDDMSLNFYQDYQSPTIPSQRLLSRHVQSQVDTALESYQSITPSPINPFASRVMSGYSPFEGRDVMPTITTNPPQLELQTTDKLPWWLPRRRPDMIGNVMDVQSQQEDVHASSSSSLLRVIADMIWASAGTQQHGHEKEMVPIVVIRVRTEEGIQRIARFRGYLIKANLSLGDQVSLWGRKRGGVLFVQRAYNHTARAIVSTHSTGSSFSFMLLSFLLLLSIAAFIIVNHISFTFFINLLPWMH